MSGEQNGRAVLLEVIHHKRKQFDFAAFDIDFQCLEGRQLQKRACGFPCETRDLDSLCGVGAEEARGTLAEASHHGSHGAERVRLAYGAGESPHGKRTIEAEIAEEALVSERVGLEACHMGTAVVGKENGRADPCADVAVVSSGPDDFLQRAESFGFPCSRIHFVPELTVIRKHPDAVATEVDGAVTSPLVEGILQAAWQ